MPGGGAFLGAGSVPADIVPRMFGGTLGTTLASCLVLLLLYRRLRRHVGRQRVSLSRLVFRILVIGAVSVLIGTLLWISSSAFLVAGFLGVALAWLALRLTAFENDAEGSYHTPNGFRG